MPATKVQAVRVFVRDRQLFHPLIGIPIALTVAGPERHQTRGLLVTGRNGYVSFKVRVRRGERLFVHLPGRPEPRIEVDAQDEAVHFLDLDSAQAREAGTLSGVPSMVTPDARDYALQRSDLISAQPFPHDPFVPQQPAVDGAGPSPWPFAPCENAPDPCDPCGVILPQPGTTRAYGFSRLAFDGGETLTANRVDKPCVPDILAEPHLRVRMGTAFEYDVLWRLLGHSLGELVNTFSLAPCETIRLATLDWSRRDGLQREDSATATDSARATSDRTQLLSETMEGTARKSGFSASLGLEFPIKAIKAKIGFSGGVSKSSFAGSSARRLTDSVVQTASSVRTANSVLVVEAEQTESSAVQTRVIRNHNKCHMLNLMAFEVLGHYQVLTRYKGTRKVLFIEHCPIEAFTAVQVAGLAAAFRPALLDPTLDDGFDALQQWLFCCGAGGAAQPGAGAGGGAQPDQTQYDRIQVTIQVGLTGSINQDLSQTLADLDSIHVTLRADGIPYTVAVPGRPWDDGPFFSAVIDLPIPIAAEDVTAVTVRSEITPVPMGFRLSQFNVTLLGDGTAYQLINALNVGSERSFPINQAAPDTADDTDLVSSDVPATATNCATAECRAQALLNHINQNVMYYNAARWLAEDEATRGFRFDQFELNGVPLLSQVQLTPLGVAGNWVAYAASDDILDDDSVNANNEFTEAVAFLPTNGVYTEALVGRCSACETVPDADGNPVEYRDFECLDATSIEPVSLPAPENTTDALTGLTSAGVGNLVSIGALPTTDLSKLTSVLDGLLTALNGAADDPPGDADAGGDDSDGGGGDGDGGDGDGGDGDGDPDDGEPGDGDDQDPQPGDGDGEPPVPPTEPPDGEDIAGG